MYFGDESRHLRTDVNIGFALYDCGVGGAEVAAAGLHRHYSDLRNLLGGGLLFSAARTESYGGAGCGETYAHRLEHFYLHRIIIVYMYFNNRKWINICYIAHGVHKNVAKLLIIINTTTAWISNKLVIIGIGGFKKDIIRWKYVNLQSENLSNLIRV